MPESQKRDIIDQWIVDPFNQLISNSKSGGLVLFGSAILALFLANSPFADSYHHLWETPVRIGFGANTLEKTLHHWINDGLMAMFFFVVGLELKRELIAGELKNPRNAVLPIAAAIGGMVVPALVFLAFNQDDPANRAGWGIPMATDIAFALGVLYLLGDKAPYSFKIFLTAIAIVDDLGAVLVIAFFYTSQIDFLNLGIGFLILAVMIGANFAGVRSSLFYGLLGIGGLWLAFLLSGVHATIAAVLAAFAIPAKAKKEEIHFVKDAGKLIHEFQQEQSTVDSLMTYRQYKILAKIKKLTKNSIPPLQRLEHSLHPIVAFIVMPIFALSNAGVTITGSIASGLFSDVTIGVFLGLILGKAAGITGITYLMVKNKLAVLPEKMTMTHVAGIAFLAGIGFTMSLFISGLAYEEGSSQLLQAKLGILISSVIASFAGYFFLNRSMKLK